MKKETLTLSGIFALALLVALVLLGLGSLGLVGCDNSQTAMPPVQNFPVINNGDVVVTFAGSVTGQVYSAGPQVSSVRVCLLVGKSLEK